MIPFSRRDALVTKKFEPKCPDVASAHGMILNLAQASNVRYMISFRACVISVDMFYDF